MMLFSNKHSPVTRTMLFRDPINPSLDGNTVEMAVEQMELSNVIRYQTTLQFLNNRISGLMSAIRGSRKIIKMPDVKNIFDIAGRSMASQMIRLNTVAVNLANAGAVTGDTVLLALKPVFETNLLTSLRALGCLRWM